MNTRMRVATVSDLPVIIRHRRPMCSEMGCRDETALDAMEATSRPFIGAGLADGSYRGWLVDTDAQHVHRTRAPGAGVRQVDGRNHDGLVSRAHVGWVSLHASEAGRHLYETLGFATTNEMHLLLR